jgi:hypothetical protein
MTTTLPLVLLRVLGSAWFCMDGLGWRGNDVQSADRRRWATSWRGFVSATSAEAAQMSIL